MPSDILSVVHGILHLVVAGMTLSWGYINQVLQHVEVAKYLGIFIQNTLCFDRHVQDVTSRANSRLGFLKRNLKGVPSALKRTAYVSLVRSGLEYGAAVWDPFTHDQKRKVELVQNRAMRWICDLPPFDRSSISTLLKDTHLDTLESRRRDARLTLMFKVVHGHVAIAPGHLGLESADGRTRASHGHKFKERGSRKQQLKHSFVVRTVPEWNRLPASVAEAVSVDSFKAQLAAAHRP